MLLDHLHTLERLAKGSKLLRLLHNPYKYLLAQACSRLPYGLLRKGLRVTTHTFWGEPFVVHLPAGTDIYLTGGKSDDSEIRLARYMAEVLKEGDVFIDIGSHFGYYSCLALNCIKESGRVIALEPSRLSYQILQANLSRYPNAILLHALAGEQHRVKDFYEFPVAYSEYSTVYPEQFRGQSWFARTEVRSSPVECLTIDALVATQDVVPSFIKIDTEGSELDVLKGARSTLEQYQNIIIAMEYLATSRGNQGHVRAVAFMRELGYTTFVITPAGTVQECSDLENHLQEQKLDSDNIICKKRTALA